MSSFKTEKYKEELERIAKRNRRGISFVIDWDEPVVELHKKDFLIANLTDQNDSDICEMLILPEGWYYNGETNVDSFLQRMCYLYEIAEYVLMDEPTVDFYVGSSGAEPNEFVCYETNLEHFLCCLTDTIGQSGTSKDIHIRVSR